MLLLWLLLSDNQTLANNDSFRLSYCERCSFCCCCCCCCCCYFTWWCLPVPLKAFVVAPLTTRHWKTTTAPGWVLWILFCLWMLLSSTTGLWWTTTARRQVNIVCLVLKKNVVQMPFLSFYKMDRMFKLSPCLQCFLLLFSLFLQTTFQSMFEGLARRYGGCDGPDCGHQWDGDIRGHVSFLSHQGLCRFSFDF